MSNNLNMCNATIYLAPVGSLLPDIDISQRHLVSDCNDSNLYNAV